MHTLRWSDEVRDPADVVSEPDAASEPSEDELQAATAVITAMQGQWRPDDYEDAYTARVERLLEEKTQGRQLEPETAPPEPTPVTDLETVLRESLASAKTRRSG
ncbi:Ku family protein [Saccharopolyspora pogona]|uniref:hypothetical protein n=1 Tax=Saccharopolyspora pogona TaxID=333966 RepID=UPI0016856D6B|nr:hypothetical protein [Saccharopolyspora pogona]